jgi:hypothetical protein
MKTLLGICLTGCAASLLVAAELPLPQRVEAYLRPQLQTVTPGTVDDGVEARILARPDPETFFLRYAYGLQRNARKLLTEAQAKQLATVIQQHTPAHSRWHDERNTLRCKWNEILWRYAAAGESEAPALRRELAEWMRLRMLWTQQEHLAQYRFARDVWNVLMPEQQAKLMGGEWKPYAKLETGHTRADATAKIITRALGKPDHAAAFETASAAWSKERQPLHAALTVAENNERRLVFAMDLNHQALAFRAAVAATDAYAKLYQVEADATRRLVRAGYTDAAARCAKAAADAWAEASKRFSSGAAGLLLLMGSE